MLEDENKEKHIVYLKSKSIFFSLLNFANRLIKYLKYP